MPNMEVDNYTQDLSQWNSFANDGRGASGIKKVPGEISERSYRRILRDAKTDYLDGFGIDWSQYDEGKVLFFDMTTAQAEFTHKENEKKIVLTRIYFSKSTGRIHQAGTQYGELTL